MAVSRLAELIFYLVHTRQRIKYDLASLYGNMRNSGSYQTETPEPIGMKIFKIDQVCNLT
jgi:hypothetical protein